jgi:hypothetical protein
MGGRAMSERAAQPGRLGVVETGTRVARRRALLRPDGEALYDVHGRLALSGG